MSKKFKSQASSARAASNLTGGFGFGSSFQTSSSSLSYVTETPDLSQISDPNVVVALKNLGKKDSTTKAKALEDLQDHFNGDVEQSLLQAWADIYPRTSIDNSRKVRQLTHALQGNLTASAGKRIAPLLPKVIGSWLAGTFDGDKSVSRAAQDALEKSFTTPEKRKALWNVYKDALFDYIEDAIMIQTTTTLSDERTTSKDEAQAKHVRVVGTAIHMLIMLLKDGARNDLISNILSGKKIWESITHEDAYLRRSVCELAVVASENCSGQLDWKIMSTYFLSKGLSSNQMGSSRQYATALTALTQQRPELWTSDYSAKTTITKRLTQYLRQGSQNGPEDVWLSIATLIQQIPQEVWLGSDQLESATNLVEALRTGVTQPTERQNIVAAWTAYVKICLWLVGQIKTGRSDFIDQQIVPIVTQYVTRKEERTWSIPIRAGQICTGILIAFIRQELLSEFEKTWLELVSLTVDKMKLSQPETSKDFKTSQDAVIDQAKRLFGIETDLAKCPEATQVSSILQRAGTTMLDAAIQVLRTRNGKPYAAAAIVEFIVLRPGFDKNNNTIQHFLKEDLSHLLNSPSSEKLASIALANGQTNIIDLLFAQRAENTDKALRRVMVSINPSDLSDESQRRLLSLRINDTTDRELMLSTIQNPALKSLHSQLCHQIKDAISLSNDQDMQESALTLLQELLSQPDAANVMTADENQALLLPNLLLLAESSGDMSDGAQTIISKMSGRAGSRTGSTSIIQQQLNGEGKALSVITLIDLAKDVIKDNATDLDAILPTRTMWEKALLPHVGIRRPYALSITSPLQGVIYVIDPQAKSNGVQPIRDDDDFALAFRLTYYVTKLMTPEVFARLSSERLKDLFAIYPLALQLVNENLTIENANMIWIHSTPEVREEAAYVLSEGNQLVQSWFEKNDFVSYWLKGQCTIREQDMSAYITALAWTDIVDRYIDQHGPSELLRDHEEELKLIHKPDNIVRSAALVATLGEPFATTATGKRVLNELIASATELKAGHISPLVLLNVLLHGDSETLDAIPTQRMVFLLKNLVRLLEDGKTLGMQSEVIKLLTVLAPQVQEIYGEHWEQILDSLVRLWSSDCDLPTMNSSVRLYAKLKSLLQAEDPNEDLQEAWKATTPELNEGLLECLKQLSQTTTEIDTPRTITAELVRRQLRGIELKNIEGIFGLLSSPVEAVQNAAFEILHRIVPQQQEQLSIELLLEKKPAQLPQDLLALLAEHSTNSKLYMLAWKLVFDHFSNASYRLQEAYTEDLKASDHTGGLLDFTCQSLNILSGRPVDASKFDVANFDVEEAESSDKQLHWLAIHNYYNTLRFVPSLAKDWFISQKNRVKSPLEAWTQKHISPLIVAASLSTVSDWATAQSQDDDDKSLTIKSSPRGSELTASISVDPESPPISLAISLPGSYPLESPLVASRARVGVSEKNWQSWLRTIQIIVISTGSIIEGLIAFRKNVQGALKGQSECAICYSIIGTDMQTPNKKCGTCKNNFHGTCLFRWFKSSNSSSCPLCRNNFNYA